MNSDLKPPNLDDTKDEPTHGSNDGAAKEAEYEKKLFTMSKRNRRRRNKSVAHTSALTHIRIPSPTSPRPNSPTGSARAPQLLVTRKKSTFSKVSVDPKSYPYDSNVKETYIRSLMNARNRKRWQDLIEKDLI